MCVSYLVIWNVIYRPTCVFCMREPIELGHHFTVVIWPYFMFHCDDFSMFLSRPTYHVMWIYYYIILFTILVRCNDKHIFKRKVTRWRTGKSQGADGVKWETYGNWYKKCMNPFTQWMDIQTVVDLPEGGRGTLCPSSPHYIYVIFG